MPVEALFLDFGGTLATRDPDPWTILLDVCAQRGRELTLADLGRGRAKADRTLRSVDFQTMELMEEFWVRWFELILEGLGIPEASTIAREGRRRMIAESRILLYDEVPDVLQELEGVDKPLGIVSNYNCNLEPYCMELGIADHFDFILASDMLRSGKPYPRIFELAVREAGVPASACLHVGDSIGADYEGAIGAGLQALLVDRGGEAGEAYSSVPDLRGVLELVKES